MSRKGKEEALDMKFGATGSSNQVLQGGEEVETKHVSKEIGVVIREAAESELEISSSVSERVKRRRSVPRRLVEDTPWSPPRKRVKSRETAARGSSTVSVALEEDVHAPIVGCPIDSMDDELLACVLMKLNMKDLSASMRTCKRWHRVACKEDVWEHIPLPANVPGALPRSIKALAWLCTKFGG